MTFQIFIKTLLRFILKPLSFIPALVMMYIIFSFSAQDGAASASLSYKVTYKAVSIAEDPPGDHQPDTAYTVHIQRKSYGDR